jgi:phospholipid-binding lipoprotein MlaA
VFRRSRCLRWVIETIYAIVMVTMIGCAGAPPRSASTPTVKPAVSGEVDAGSSALTSPKQRVGTSTTDSTDAAAKERTADPQDDPFYDPFARNDETPGGEEYDPWEPFNTKIFEFNRQVDRWVLKPVAQGYDAVVPNPVQIGISNVFYNIRFPSRFINNLAQGKLSGAGTEVGRFLLNSTFGLAGLFDVARYLDITTPEEDTGQTLGYYGVKPGPYLVVPFLPPFTVRDFFGYLGDIALNPINWLVFPIIEVDGIPSLVAHHNRMTSSIVQISMRVGEIVNDRSLNLEKFQGVEEATLDLYTSVKNAYLQKRRNQIRE